MKYQGMQMDARARAAESNYATTRLQVLLLSSSAVLCALGIAIFATRAVGRETTERKRAQASLQLAHDDLESRVLERTRELENVHKKLLETSRLAGMAEVATTVLHNVGNVLNSVNVSANMISDRLKKSKGNTVAKAAALMDEHANDLAEFMTKDPKGRQLPTFLKQLAGRLEEEKHAILQESASLAKNVDHIKDIIAAQQSYAKIAGVTETFKITEAVEVALSMNASALARHDVRVSREYDPAAPAVTLERHKVLQILVNVIRNAKQACDEAAPTEKHLTIRVTTAGGRVRVALTDNGIGIAAANLTRVFNHGFTTKKEGHGFGMHSGALAAKEMGGSLSVQSAGPGTGATVTLELPCQPSAPREILASAQP
jgi:C4-dicarboxylate-specific signal transduction histidine kinase